MQILKLDGLCKQYPAFRLENVSFSMEAGTIMGLIGRNGAGKTTTLHAISGLVKPKNGEIAFCGANLRTTSAHKIIRLGLAQVPEGRRVFSHMTVQENLEMGAYARKDRGRLNDEFERIFQRLPRLKERRKQVAGTLSGGEQQMLAIGRALMSNPKMLLLDEPSMGLSPLLVEEIFQIIQDVNKSGVTVLLVEQNAKMAMQIANRVYVMETGTIMMSGNSEEMRNNEQVRRAYLGG